MNRPHRNGGGRRGRPETGALPSADPARLTVVVESLERDGRGKALRHDRAVLLPQAYPGEAVAFRVDVATKGALQGRVLKVLKPGPDRVPHPCSHEFHCTGCPLLSYRPTAEARFKTGLVRRALAGVSGDGRDPVRPLVAPASPFGYRHYGKQVFARREGRVVLGSYVQGTHRVADNRGCPVLAPGLARLFDRLADLVHEAELVLHEPGSARGLRHAVARWSRARGKAQLVLATSEPGAAAASTFAASLEAALPEIESTFVLEQEGEGNVLLAGAPHLVFGPGALEESILGHSFAVGPRSFFQVNPWGAETIFSYALEFAGRGASALELYAGVGALTLPLAGRFAEVFAAESSAEAAEAARRNAARAGLSGVTVETAAAEVAAPRLLAERRPEVVVADPPRKGLGAELATILAKGPAARVVLLSCDPAALGRDAAAMVAAGRTLAAVQPVDQFPRTAHVETVALFT
jgi:23S rRNA (uracil1939-C5)-methyltransferase